MNKECRNDCVEKPLFPRPITNRPGLSNINYRIGTYSDILEKLLWNLNRNSVLNKWTHREPDDPGIAMLEGASILGDILTFYQELYVNEAFLRTANWRESIADLVRLTGYLLSPGIGGKAVFAVEVKDKNKNNKPVVIPKKLPIKAQVKGVEQTVDFETLKETTAYPALSKFNLYRQLNTPYIIQNTNEFYLFSPDQYLNPVKLEKGDRLLIGDANPATEPSLLQNEEIVIIDGIREQHGYKIYKIKGKLKRTGNSTEISGFKLGRTFHHFGFNAPRKFQNLANDTVNIENQLYVRPLAAKTVSIESPTLDITGVKGVRIVEPDLAALDFPLDSEVNNIALGSKFIVQGLFYGNSINKEFTLVRNVKNIKTGSVTWGAISASSSLVTLDSYLTIMEGSNNYYVADIRFLQFHEVLSPQLRLHAGLQETSEIKGKELYFYGTDAQVQSMKDRQLLFEKAGEKPYILNVAAVESSFSSLSTRNELRKITLNKDVHYADFPNENPLVTVYGNLLNADQGKTEKEVVLGNGNNSQKFQTFKLPKTPLTYYNQSDETPPEVPELKIYINDKLWKRVAVFFERKPEEEIYIVREDKEGNSWIQFGDGKTGKRLPTGFENVLAVYRTGTGAYGELKDGTNPLPGGKVDGLEKIYMPGPASGGDEPEKGDNAKNAAPGKTQALGRLVSLRDYESEALAVPGVSKAFANWQVSAKESVVSLILLMEYGRTGEFTKVRDILNKYNICRGPKRFPVDVVEGKRIYLYIHTEFAFDATLKEDKVKDAIKKALGVFGEEGKGIDGRDGLFGLKNRRFGQNAYASRIEAVVQNVDGVIWVKVTSLESLGEADDPTTVSASASPGYSKTVVCDSRHVLCLYTKHLQLSVSKDETKGRC